MDIEEVLKQAEALVYAKTGKKLEHLQKTVLKGTIQGQTYPEIAEEHGFSESHVKNIGHELWNTLSSAVGEKVTKSNFKAIFKSLKDNNFSHAISGVCQNNSTFNNINIFTSEHQSYTPTLQPQQNAPPTHIDLGHAPEIFNFYNRTSELAALENFLTEKQTRLIALLGISGIGKTTLAIRLIDRIKTEFNYIIYRSLRFSPTLETTLTNLLKIFSESSEIPQNIETKISHLLDYLRKYRCLIILDDIQELFSSGQLAGEYKTGYEDYPLFFKLIAQVPHNSSLLLISSENPREIAQLEKENYPINTLILGNLGIAAKDILNSHQLLDEETWETLINIYQGNPQWLNITATLIRELFSGRVAHFLKYEPTILDESLQNHLYQQLQRLTAQEQALILHLVNETEPLALSQILNKNNISTSDLINVIQSLGRRFLVEKKDIEKSTFFSLNPVVAQYVKTKNSPQ